MKRLLSLTRKIAPWRWRIRSLQLTQESQMHAAPKEGGLHGKHGSVAVLLRWRNDSALVWATARECAGGAERVHHPHISSGPDSLVCARNRSPFGHHLPNRRPLAPVSSWRHFLHGHRTVCRLVSPNDRRTDPRRLSREYIVRRAADDRGLLRAELSWPWHSKWTNSARIWSSLRLGFWSR